MNFKECVRDYIQHFRSSADGEREFYEKQRNLSDAISISATSKTSDGKRHSHQRRIPVAALCEAERNLLDVVELLEAVKDFDSLHEAVNDAIRPIHGIGQLTVYDISHRIGSYRQLDPQRVYLHAGARMGAAALGFKGNTIEKYHLPSEFALLTAAEVEDLLCIYKDILDGSETSPLGCGTRAPVTGCRSVKKLKTRRC